MPRTAVRGRVCPWCGRTDGETRFHRSECWACHRRAQPSRNGRCERCRAPLKKRRVQVLTLGCWPAVVSQDDARGYETYCERCDG